MADRTSSADQCVVSWYEVTARRCELASDAELACKIFGADIRHGRNRLEIATIGNETPPKADQPVRRVFPNR